MTKRKNSKKVMLQHSEAKVDLLEKYLSVYLNILHRARGINKIYLFDLFAGEGIYEKRKKGSPLVILETIKNHYYANSGDCPNIHVHINEPGESQIEPGILKIERIKREAENIYNPANVTREYTQLEYESIIEDVLDKVKALSSSERALLFVDPWGYSQVKFEEILSIKDSNKVELILFLPINFMYRFAQKSLSTDDFPAGEKLEAFLKSIFQHEKPNLTDQESFITSIKKALRDHSVSEYVDTFVIERSKGKLFSLFFFTDHPLGAQKMLETKWNLDEQRGRGFRIDMAANQSSLFKGIEGSNYPRLLLHFIKKNEGVTNSDIYEFGLRNGFLPKHSNEVLKKLKKEDVIIVISKDEKPIRGNYIKLNSNRIVEFKLNK